LVGLLLGNGLHIGLQGVHIANTSWIKQSPLAFFGLQLAVYFASYFVFLVVKISGLTYIMIKQAQ
jgi:hypothetical protein